jgi:mRNA interferase HicA
VRDFVAQIARLKRERNAALLNQMAELGRRQSALGVLSTRTYLCEYPNMNGHEFERKIRGIGRHRGVPVSFDAGHGKGSHGRLYYGDRFTTLKDRRKEIGPGLLGAMLKQLGLSRKDLEIG